MNKGLFKFDYIVYDGTNAQEIEDEFNLDCIEEDGELIIDSESEVILEKGDCLIPMSDYIRVMRKDSFKEKFMGDIKEYE